MTQRLHQFFNTVIIFLVGTFLVNPYFPNSLLASSKIDDVMIEDREFGEGNRTRLRQEWFFKTRRAGATDRLALMRYKGVIQARKDIIASGQDLLEGTSNGLNIWTNKGPAPSTFGGWTFGNVAGRVITLAKDWTNDILYIGAASGGLWKSTDDGLSWTNIFDVAGSCTIGVVTVDPNNPQTLWVGTGENSKSCETYFGIGLLRSTDGGVTWELRNGSGFSSLENLSTFASIIVDPRDSNHLIVGGRLRDCVNGNYQLGGIYTSDDAGTSWTKRVTCGLTEIVQDPVNRDVYWAGTGNHGLMKSTDNAQTWQIQSNSGLPTGSVGRTEVTVSPVDNDYVYALFASVGGTSEFWRTINGGTTWTKMCSGSSACDGQCTYNMVLRPHQTNVNTVFRGTIRIYRSTDGGNDWTDLINGWSSSQKVHQDIHDFLMNPYDANEFYIGCDGGVWKTENGGSSFLNLNGNLCVTQFYAIANHPTDDDIILGGTQDNSSLARTSTDVWDLQQVTGDGFVCHINPVETNYVYIAGYPYDHYLGYVPSVYRSSNGVFGNFSHITNVYNGIAANDRIDWVTPYIIDPTDPDCLFLGTHRLYRSTNKGSSWTQVGPTDMTGGSGNILSLEVNRSNGKYVFAGTTDSKIWRSTDGGNNWTDISSGLPNRTINDIASDPDNPIRAFCVVGGFGTAHVYEHTGTGDWQSCGFKLPNVPTNTVYMRSSNDIFIGSDVGVYRSLDGGSTFTPFMDGLPVGVVVTDLKYSPDTETLTLGTYGRGAWQYTLDESLVPTLGRNYLAWLFLITIFSFGIWRKAKAIRLR